MTFVGNFGISNKSDDLLNVLMRWELSFHRREYRYLPTFCDLAPPLLKPALAGPGLMGHVDGATAAWGLMGHAN